MSDLARKLYAKLQRLRFSSVDKLDFRQTYSRHVSTLQQEHGLDRAMQLAVGGEFAAIGQIELEMLRYFGLKENHYIIDAGCGSGRLAQPLSRFLTGKYLGIDVVPELVAYARRLVGRTDWQFKVANGLTIPEQEGVADFVCFFSIFTHLLHEQSYAYLKEAKRVLKPDGRIVFTFLDFLVPGHWPVFESNITDLSVRAQPLNMFLSREAITVWAQHLGLDVLASEGGDQVFIPLSHPIAFENGAIAREKVAFGQSVCVLQKQ